jgi:hypothetical protein
MPKRTHSLSSYRCPNIFSSGDPGNCLEFNRIDELADCAQHPVKACLLLLPSDLVALRAT